MKTMNDYTTYCTEEQTRRAYKLGVPIESKTKAGYYCNKEYPIQLNVFQYGKVPTTQQMIGWLREENGIKIQIHHYTIESMGYKAYIFANVTYNTLNYATYEQAELAAIDAALDYLEKGGENV